jgi:hypothetical protein
MTSTARSLPAAACISSGGLVETLDEVKARRRPDGKDDILISNMEGNGYKRIVTNDNSWRWTQPLEEGDTVLDWKPRKRRKTA